MYFLYKLLIINIHTFFFFNILTKVGFKEKKEIVELNEEVYVNLNTM